MSRNDVEVLEVGDDGAFETSTQSVSQKALSQNDDEFIHVKEQSTDVLNQQIFEELSTEISSPGQYKMFQNDTDLYLFIVIEEQESVKSLFIRESACEVHTNNGKSYKVALPSDLTFDISNSKSNGFKQYVTVKIPFSA